MTRSQASAAPATVPEIDGYRLERRLGEGGMAEVWAAVQLSLGRAVAIKILAADPRTGEEAALRFEREARTIARLEHPNIVGIFDVGRTADGRAYYSMPLLPGGDLAARDLRARPSEILRVLRAILAGLAHAHVAGIVHRDIKPANVLFDRNDIPQLADFGIARSREDDARVTTERQTIGSSAYMSPEQARSADVDARADLYSVGIVCYELLTGDVPYHGVDALAVALAHVEQPIPRLPRTKRAWQPFIDRALAKRPEDRFQTATDMLHALDEVQRALRTSERDTAPLPGLPPPAPSARRTGVRGPRSGLVLALGAAALALAALLWNGLGRDGAETATEASVRDAPARGGPAAGSLDLDQRRQLHDQAAALLALGQALLPAEASAAARYATLLADRDDDAAARNGLARALDLAAVQAEQALAADDGARAAALHAAARPYGVTSPEALGAFDARYVAALAARLDQALARGDGGILTRLQAALAPVGTDGPELAPRLARLGALPTAGARLADPRGLPLRWVPASERAAALAVTETEITRGQWRSFVSERPRAAAGCRDPGNLLGFLARRDWRDPGFAQADDHPVVCVTPEDARAYAAWLSARTGRRYRLPSAAEWRRITAGQPARGCRDGNVRDRSAGGSDRFDCRDGHAETAPVGAPATGPYAIAGLVGNVREWLADCAQRSGNRCEAHAVAGSSWRSGPGDGLLAVGEAASDRGWTDIGFRLVRELDADGPPPPAR